MIEIQYFDDRIVLEYATSGSAAFDLVAATHNLIEIRPGEIKKIGSGIALHIGQSDLCAFLLPRSGKAKSGLTVANSPGLIDSDYQGEIGILMHNVSKLTQVIKPLDRIAQLIFVPVIKPQIIEVAEFSKTTERGVGGFGSTG